MKKSGGVGRPSINHFTICGKVTLCNKQIPESAFCYDAFGPTDCEKCRIEKERSFLPKTYEDKLSYFKKVVEDLGGTYVDNEHCGWWDAYGGKEALENRCVAYGKLSFMNVFMVNNWLYFKESPV